MRARFEREYRTVRRAEGWGSLDGTYYRALPHGDLSGRFRKIWRIRARSFDCFVERVLEPLERTGVHSLAVLDLGAGNGWLAYRLAQRGHKVAAIDVLVDAVDGLGAARHYPARFAPIQAEFDSLPFASEFADLAIFNGSLHYSLNIARTLKEALRVLRQGGTLVVLDSPMYSDLASGQQMVLERQKRFARQYAFAADPLPFEHFLTPARLAALARELDVRWSLLQPHGSWRAPLGRAVARVRSGRAPATFPLIVGRRA